MSLLHADPVDLERVTVLDVIFAETAGVRSVSSKIGSFNRKGQGYFGEKMKGGDNILNDRRTDMSRGRCGTSSSAHLKNRTQFPPSPHGGSCRCPMPH